MFVLTDGVFYISHLVFFLFYEPGLLCQKRGFCDLRGMFYGVIYISRFGCSNLKSKTRIGQVRFLFVFYNEKKSSTSTVFVFQLEEHNPLFE